MAQVSTMMM
jgi:hypothetical protein